nr:hypothetical protein [Tanacetum cinerariifolium]
METETITEAMIQDVAIEGQLALLYARMLLEVSDIVEKYTGGLPNNIQGYVMTAMPKMLQEAIELKNDLMDQKKEYDGTIPLCNKCKFYNNGPCTVTCANCKRVGHLTRDCRIPTAANNQRPFTCFECGEQGHYRNECPKLKNRNDGNQTTSGKAHGSVYALGRGETDQDPNNITDDIDA